MDGRDSNPPADLDSLSRVDSLWFEDADVVFCAGKSKFRVYRGILSAQSTKFRNMFVLPQSSGESANVAKTQNTTVLVINLPDDERDVQFFFLGIFDPSFYMPLPSQYDLEVTISILRLSQKYQVPFLIQRAMSHLDSFFPLDFKTMLENPPKPPKNRSSTKLFLDRMLKCYLDALPLAISANGTWIIPSLLCILNLIYRLETIMTHSSFADLSSQLQVLIVRSCVNNALSESHDNTWVGMLPSSQCSDEEACALVSRTAQTLCRTSQNPVHWNVKMRTPDGKMFCRGCQAAGRKAQQELEQKYWNQYAIICGFKNWEEVRKLRGKSMDGSS